MVHIHNMEQGTEEWFEFRKAKLTGSNATPIAANGAGLKTYCKKVAMQMCGIHIDEYTNSDIERGNELEIYGQQAYELQTGFTVENVGSVTNDLYPDVSVSPDGLVGDDGGIEIKARNDEKHFGLLLGETKEIPVNQIQMCLLITERKWWDFISINPNFSKPLFVQRIFPDLKYHEKLKAGFITGRNLIKEYVELYEKFK